MGHDVRASTKGAYRHTAANDFGQGGEVRLDAGEALYALRADTEAGHDLVENQYRTVACAKFAQAFQESRLRFDEIHVAGNRLNDDAGDLVRVFGESRFHRFQIVEIQHQRVLNELAGHTRRCRIAESQHARSCLDQQAVGVAVVTALELDDSRAPGVAPGQADGR